MYNMPNVPMPVSPISNAPMPVSPISNAPMPAYPTSPVSGVCPISPAMGKCPACPIMPAMPTLPAYQYPANMPGYPGAPTLGAYSPETLEKMYPDIYVIIHVKVREMCMMMDTPFNPEMYPCPSKALLDRMTDDIYAKVIIEIGEPELGEEDTAKKPVSDEADALQEFPDFRRDRRRRRFDRRDFLQDLVQILLIRELLSRRGFGF